MNNEKKACLIFVWTCIVILGSVDPMATHPRTVNSWRKFEGLRRREPLKVVSSIPISYRLDAWSQYDNPEEGKAREGDILQTFRKTTTTDETLIWPNGVVRYFVDDSIVNEPAKLAVLEEAMENIMELTCLKFVRIFADTNGKFPSHNWVNISGNEPGCFSDLGRSHSGPSLMNLDVKKCFRTKGHPLHEILHTLGVFHEHMRPDRDQHIKILWQNIKAEDAFNFRIMDADSVTNYGLPYDYDSIMHYSMTAFSKDKSAPTIIPRKSNSVIGQRNHLSFYDVQKLLITYKCDGISPEYLHKKMAHDQSDRLEILHFNSTENSLVSSASRAMSSSRATIKFRNYEPLYPMPIPHQTGVPNMWNPYYYDYVYPDYVPQNLPPNDYYYYE